MKAAVRYRIGALLIAALCVPTAFMLSARADTELTRAYRIIARKQFVDLTHSFGPDTPVWSGFGQAKFSPAADPKTHEPYTIARTASAPPITRWSGNTAPTSIRRRILPSTGSPWIRSRSSR